MSEKETKQQPVVTEVEKTTHQSTEESAQVKAAYVPVESPGQKKSKMWMYIAAIGIVAFTLLVVFFLLEKEGRSSTGVFDSYFAAQENKAVVAVVNGEDITAGDLNTSIQQFSQAAVAQGIDIENPAVRADVRNQALEVLVNTVLLKQAAQEQGIEVSDQQAAERLDTIKSEIGGEEVLLARISELGLTYADLEEDIKEEILVQTLLDSVFAEAGIEVTEEELQAVYDAAGGSEAGLPPLEDVREQIEAQVRGSKEQEVIDEYLSTLKTDAEVDTL